MSGDEELKGLVEINLLTNETTMTNSGTSYVEVLASYRDTIDFSKFGADRARIVISATGNEAGAGKGIEVYNVTDSVQIAEKTWTGNTLQAAITGSWVSVNHLHKEVTITARSKASSGTEDIIIRKVTLQIQTHGLKIARTG